MVGIPETLQTSRDWKNAFNYALEKKRGRQQLAEMLEAVLKTRTITVLKPGINKDADDIRQDDLETINDPASAFQKSGLSENEVIEMINQLKGDKNGTV